MGFCRYMGSILLGCLTEIREHVAAFLAASVANLAIFVYAKDFLDSVGFGHIEELVYWTPKIVLVLCIWLVLSRAHYAKFVDIEAKLSEGVVCRLVQVEIHESGKFNFNVATTVDGVPKLLIEQRVDWNAWVHCEVINNTDRISLLSIEAFYDVGGKVEKVTRRAPRPGDVEKVEFKPKSVWQISHECQPVKAVSKGGQPPKLVRVELVDHATHPSRRLSLKALGSSGRIA